MPPILMMPGSDDVIQSFDICIIGAGPAGLAALSAVMEPYSRDHLSESEQRRADKAFLKNRVPFQKKRSVCVIDPETWISKWRQRFSSLDIRWLRSFAVMHPDLFDASSLHAYAFSTGRESELLEVDYGELKEVRSLSEVHSGLWNLPSNKLFQDFCLDLVSRLPHHFIRGEAASVEGSDGKYYVTLQDGRSVRCGAVVLALGAPGPPVIPQSFERLKPPQLMHLGWDCGKGFAKITAKQRVLVIGGGLTAVQAAQLALRRGCQEVVLCSRRPLVERRLDLPLGWFDRRKTQGYFYSFLEKSLPERVAMIKEVRGGGSVPRLYMDDILAEQRKKDSRLEVVCEQARLKGTTDSGRLSVEINGRVREFDVVISACGHRMDCSAIPLLNDLLKRFPVDVVEGLPQLSHDLQWGACQRLFAIGALASLQVGPDAGNLGGIRRAAHILSGALGTRQQVRSSVQVNTFTGLCSYSSDDDSSESSDDD